MPRNLPNHLQPPKEERSKEMETGRFEHLRRMLRKNKSQADFAEISTNQKHLLHQTTLVYLLYFLSAHFSHLYY